MNLERIGVVVSIILALGTAIGALISINNEIVRSQEGRTQIIEQLRSQDDQTRKELDDLRTRLTRIADSIGAGQETVNDLEDRVIVLEERVRFSMEKARQ
jgi:predicted  nucleic acid-binding Zn-ribbon protein